MANATESGHAPQKKAVYAIIGVGCLVIVALVGVIIALLMSLGGESAPAEELPPQRSIVINEDNINEALSQIDTTPVQAGYYEARMTTTWTFPDGASPSTDAYVENVPGNTNDVYFDVQMADTEETIYESPLIPLGGHLDNIVLNRDLDAGTYEAVVIYHLVDEQQRTLSTLRMAITLIIES